MTNRFFGAFSLCTAAALACGCGTSLRGSSILDNITGGNTQNQADFRTLKAVAGSLAGVKIKAGPAGSFATYAEVSYTVACYEHLESVTTAVAEQEGQFTVYFSGVVSRVGGADWVRCVGLSVRTAEVALSGGIIDSGAVDVVNVDLMPTSMKVEGKDLSLKPLGGAEVTGTQPLCPSEPGIECVLNGTVVQISFDRRCSQKPGPMGYAIEKLPANRVRLAVVAYAMGKDDSAAVSCQSLEAQTMTVTLVNSFVGAGDLEVVGLR